MIRTIHMIIGLFFDVIALEFVNFKLSYLKRKGRTKERRALLKKTYFRWARKIMKRTASKMHFKGRENIPKDRPYLVCANHASLLDIPLLICALDEFIGFVSKKEASKMPLIGKWILFSESVMIDRSSARNAAISIREGVELMKNNRPQVIFPEGTRTNDGKLGDFKAGSMKLAQKAGVPVIPVAIKGTYELLNKKTIKIKPTDLQVEFLQLIESEGKSSQELAQLVKESVSKALSN